MKIIKEDYKGWDDEYNPQIGIRCSKSNARKLFNQILENQYQAPLYDEFFDAVNMSDAIEIVKEWEDKAEKYDRYGDDANLYFEEKNHKLETENKQLKESITNKEKLIGDLLHDKSVLKKKLEKIKEFFEHNDILHKEYYQKILDSQHTEERKRMANGLLEGDIPDEYR